MKQNKRIIVSILWVVIGTALIGLAFAGKVDTFWNGVGSGLFVVGVLQLLRFRRFNKNSEYREKVEIEASDERYKFIRNKAWAWAGYLFIIISGMSCILFKILGQDTISLAASYAVCIMLLLYWISYAILKRKY